MPLRFLEERHRYDTFPRLCQCLELSLPDYTGPLRKSTHHQMYVSSWKEYISILWSSAHRQLQTASCWVPGIKKTALEYLMDNFLKLYRLNTVSNKGKIDKLRLYLLLMCLSCSVSSSHWRSNHWAYLFSKPLPLTALTAPVKRNSESHCFAPSLHCPSHPRPL